VRKGSRCVVRYSRVLRCLVLGNVFYRASPTKRGAGVFAVERFVFAEVSKLSLREFLVGRVGRPKKGMYHHIHLTSYL